MIKAPTGRDMLHKYFLLLLLVFVISHVACRESDWKGKKYVKNGIDVIENPEKGIWPSDKIHLIQDLVIGSEDDDPHQCFFKIRAVEVSSDGRIYILDSGNFRIVAFDENGSYLFEFGRAGSGPGEFGNPNDISLDSAGNIYVVDSQLRRVIKFNPSGQHLLSIPIQRYTRYIDVLSEDIVLLSGLQSGNFGAFGGLFDLRSQTYKFHLKLSYNTEIKIPSGVGFSLGERYQVLRNGHIYLAVSFPYEIREYNRQGKLIAKILKEDSRIKAPVIKRASFGILKNGISITERGRAGPCFLTPQELLLNNCRWPSEEKERTVIKTGIDFFDIQGKYLTTVNLPNEQRLSAVDNHNRLYLLEPEPFEKIIRVSLEGNE